MTPAMHAATCSRPPACLFYLPACLPPLLRAQAATRKSAQRQAAAAAAAAQKAAAAQQQQAAEGGVQGMLRSVQDTVQSWWHRQPVVSLPACLFFFPACLPACLPAYLPTYLPTYPTISAMCQFYAPAYTLTYPH